jgi:LysR family transcriptional regulator, chromosome initiation inhibitor
MMHYRTCWCAESFAGISASPVHHVSTADGFGAAVRAGLGWGLNPEQSAEPALADGSFVRVSDAPLYWQCWKVNTPMVKTITVTVQSVAVGLRRRRK